LREGGSELFRNFYKAQNCRKLLEKTGQNFAKKPKDLLNQETLINPLLEREKYVEKPKDLLNQETPTNPLLEREKYVKKPKDFLDQGN